MRLQAGVPREYGRETWIPWIPPVATESSTDECRVSERASEAEVFRCATAAGHLLVCFDFSERAAMPMAARGAASDPSVKMVRLSLHSFSTKELLIIAPRSTKIYFID